MSESPLTTLQLSVQSATRRNVLQRLAGATLAGVALLPLAEVAVARKKRKKSRRKKKRRNQQPARQVRGDATCPLPQDDEFIVGSLARLAQSFTAGISGDLTKAELVLDNRNGSENNYLVRLAPLVDGLPGDASLATAQASASNLPASIAAVSFTVPSPTRVVAGSSYALVLTVDGTDNFSWVQRDGTACAGRGFIADGLSAPFEPRNDLDFVFMTFVRS